MAQTSTRSSSKQKRSRSSSNGSSERGKAANKEPATSGANAGRSVVVGVATGAAGLVGGAVLATRRAKKPKRVLGVRVPGSGRGRTGVAKRAGKVGRIFS